MMLRWTFLLLCTFGVLQLTAQPPNLQHPIHLEMQQASLDDILAALTQQTGVNFAYDGKALGSQRTLSVSFHNQSLQQVLEHLGRELGFTFSIVRQQVVLRKSEPVAAPEPRFTLSGFVRDKHSAETLPGATILIRDRNTGTTTNAYGFYSLTLPAGSYEVVFSFVGYQRISQQIELQSNTRVVAELEPDNRLLVEVTIVADDQLESLRKTQTSKLAVNPRSLEQMPGFAGENGLIRSLQSFPGIQTHSDGSAFFFVRGGNKDQNLILMDEAPVYNPAHLFGFYSVIIPEVAKEISIYKADIPIDKSGRLSSLIDIQTRDGNLRNFNLEGALHPLMYRFSLESPIVTDKASFFTSFRRSNFEWIYRQNNPESDFHLQDFNARINWQINDRNRIYVSFFRGNDNYTGREQTGKVGIAWHNYTTTLRWNRLLSDRLFSNLTLYASEYNYTLFTGTFPWESGIRDGGLKYDLSWYKQPDLTLRFGASHVAHQLNPGNFSGVPDEVSPFLPKVYAGNASETALYASREKQINERWSWRAGLRLPLWLHKGPARVFTFDDQFRVADTLIFQDQQQIQAYMAPELRLSTRYMLASRTSLALSWGNYRQHLHLLSNSASPFASFELWMPSSKNIKPQRARQLAASITHLMPSAGLELTAEAYNKRMYNQIEYTDHATLLLNPLVEGQLRFGQTHAWGLELSLKMKKGRFNGWGSYTWSRVVNRFEHINQGREYPAFYDRPHDVSVFAAWLLTHRLVLSANWIWHSGSAITTPVGFYHFNGSQVPIYDQKNNYRLPPYHRLDMSLTRHLGRPDARYQHNLSFGIYNLYNRHNPISISFNKTQQGDGDFVIPSNWDGSSTLLTTQRYLSGFMPSISYKFSIQ